MSEQIDLGKENQEKLSKLALVADDDENLLAGTKLTLEMLGYEVITVNDGSKILPALKSGRKFDLLVSDVNMPQMDGLQALQGVRNDPDTSIAKTPAVLCSGGAGIGLRREIESLGAKFLEKPYSIDQLEKAIETLSGDNR